MLRTPERDEERGASATEYGLLAVAIAAVIVIIVFTLGGQVVKMFKNTCDEIGSQAQATTTCTS